LFRSIFWPGGQALCRYVLCSTNSNFLAGKRVLDLGCGSGAGAIAAVMAGGQTPVVANDIDEVNLLPYDIEQKKKSELTLLVFCQT